MFACSALEPVGVNNIVPYKTLLKVSVKYYSCGAFQQKHVIAQVCCSIEKRRKPFVMDRLTRWRAFR